MIKHFAPGVQKKCSRCGLPGPTRINPHTHEYGAMWVHIRAGNKTDRLCEPCAEKLAQIIFGKVDDPAVKKRRVKV